MDLVWSLLGNGVHNLLEDHTTDGVAEERFYAKREGIVIGGQIDNRHNDTLSDYKVTSTYKVIKNDYTDWENQLNCYAWLCQENGHTIRQLKIITFLRDWRESEILRNRDYPKTPCVVINIPLWTPEQQEEYVLERLRVHAECRPCTDKEMWAEPDKWAVMKKGGKRALRVLDSHADAINYASDNHTEAFYTDQIDIVHRKGVRRHCQRYCPVRDFCPQWKEFNG